jgi:hypothetical protein
MCPCHGGHIAAAPVPRKTKASDDIDFGARLRSFGTCSPTLRVSCRHSRARLASGWLARLYREGVEPSGPLRKVSDHMIILLSWHPDAIVAQSHTPCNRCVRVVAGVAVGSRTLPSGPPARLYSGVGDRGTRYGARNLTPRLGCGCFGVSALRPRSAFT